jgi:diguanylate cyclase (GGDEF)-like protein
MDGDLFFSMTERAQLGGDRLGRAGLRVKVLSFVVAAALAPALLVGVASYFAAQSILLEKTNGQLSTRTEAVVHGVDSWVAERRQDVEIFASSFVVTEGLARPSTAGSPSSSRIHGYLRQVQERFPLYQTLSVIDGGGRLVARAGSADMPPPAAGGDARILWVEGSGEEPALYLAQPIRGEGEAQVGTLLAAGALGSLWQRLSPELPTEAGGLRLATQSAQVSLSRNGPPVWKKAPFPGFDRCRAPAPVVSRYRTGNGVEVLGACRAVPGVDLVVIREVEATLALTSIRELRNTVLLIALGGALLVAGFAWVLVVRLIRPIEALIEGARAVSGGDYSHEVEVRSHDEFGYLGAVFNEMTRALRATHSQLEQMARTDELTGLFNRRHLDVALDAELARARRDATPLGVLMLDLDHFKAFNDRFGHPEGDARLRAVADLLRGHLRPTDTVARYGGEEFMVLLPGSPREESVRIAERIRRRLGELRTEAANAFTTGSFGLATWPEDGATATELIAAADAALYEAKRRGRDQIALAGALEPSL